MPNEDRGSPHYDQHTQKLLDLSDELDRRANTVIADANAISRRLNQVIRQSSDEEARISRTLPRPLPQPATEREKYFRRDDEPSDRDER